MGGAARRQGGRLLAVASSPAPGCESQRKRRSVPRTARQLPARLSAPAQPQFQQRFDPGAGPVLDVELTCRHSSGPASTRIAALVDSGASATLLPWSVVAELGLRRRVRYSRRGTGWSGKRLLWRSTVPIEARILDDENDSYWGPTFALDPYFVRFASDPVQLLGRGDFFTSFDVAFVSDAAGPLMIIA